MMLYIYGARTSQKSPAVSNYLMASVLEILFTVAWNLSSLQAKPSVSVTDDVGGVTDVSTVKGGSLSTNFSKSNLHNWISFI